MSTKLSTIILSSSASLVLTVLAAVAATSTASALSCNNCVYSGDIKNGQVYSTDIRNSTIVSADVKNNSLTSADLATNSVGNSELTDNIVATTITADAVYASAIFNTEFLNLGASVVTVIPDNTVGASPALFTLDNLEAWAFLGFDCQDVDGCDVTLAEDFNDGDVMFLYNAGTNTVNFTDTADVSELAGDFSMGQWDTLQVIFRDDTVTNSWLEVSRSDN